MMETGFGAVAVAARRAAISLAVSLGLVLVACSSALPPQRARAVAVVTVSCCLSVPVAPSPARLSSLGAELIGYPAVLGSTLRHMRTGSDGALWFTWDGAGTGAPPQQGVARMSAAGSVTAWGAPPAWSNPAFGDLVAEDGVIFVLIAHDGKSYIGRLSTNGVLQHEFAIPGRDNGITRGPDGALWFTGWGFDSAQAEHGFIGRMDAAGSVRAWPLPSAGFIPAAIVTGPDGALWFTEGPGGRVGRVDMSGSIAEYTIPGAGNEATPGNQNIVSGPDGALWVADGGQGVVRITTAGQVHVYAPSTYGATVGPDSCVVASDGRIWYLSRGTGTGADVFSVSSKGYMTADITLPQSFSPGAAQPLASSSDGRLWFGDVDAIARIDPAPASSGK